MGPKHAWTLRKKTIKQLEVFEMWAYRGVGEVSWMDKRENEEILEIRCIKTHRGEHQKAKMRISGTRKEV